MLSEFEKGLNGTCAFDFNANMRQVSGNHYRSKIQHWDYVIENDLDYFQGQITKYVTRWKKKNGLDDLLKAQHFLQKYIETAQLEKARMESDQGAEPTRNYVYQE